MNAPAAKPQPSLDELIARLSALHPRQIDLSLDRMHALLARLCRLLTRTPAVETASKPAPPIAIPAEIIVPAADVAPAAPHA